MRCFLGLKVKPTPELEHALEKLRELDYTKTVKTEHLHVNIRFFRNEENPEEIRKTLQNLETPKFEYQLKNLGTFPTQEFIRVVWAGTQDNQKITLLKKEVDNRLEELGHMPEKNYVPHVTLARVKRKPDQRIQKIITNHSGKNLGQQKAEHLTLWKSTLNEEGPEYEKLWTAELK